MANMGWISLHRQIMDNWLWNEKPFGIGQAWIDLLLQANHESNKFPLGNEIVVVESGGMITSQEKLAKRWGWSKTKVRRFLELLESDGMIEKKTDRKKTTIKLVNYSIFQQSEITNRPKKKQEKTDGKPIKNTNNNVNNDNNENNIIICSELEESTPNLSNYKIILNDKSFYFVPLEKLKLWKETYQAVDVEMELKKMGSWCDSNPTKRKTRKGIERFINSWLAREQDKGGTKVNDRGYVTTYNKNSFNNFQQNDYDFEALERELLAN